VIGQIMVIPWCTRDRWVKNGLDMIGKRARDVEAVSASGYPTRFRERVLPREVRRLGDAFGLKNVGVNLVTIFPGKESSIRHHHTREDELVYVLEGELVLRTNEGEEPLTAGMVAGFRAGDGNGHQLVNRSGANAVYLVVSNRHPDDTAEYPDEDLAVKKDASGKYVFSRKNGEPSE
jgi:uncharacterized cupin superfamily protein